MISLANRYLRDLVDSLPSQTILNINYNHSGETTRELLQPNNAGNTFFIGVVDACPHISESQPLPFS